MSDAPLTSDEIAAVRALLSLCFAPRPHGMEDVPGFDAHTWGHVPDRITSGHKERVARFVGLSVAPHGPLSYPKPEKMKHAGDN